MQDRSPPARGNDLQRTAGPYIRVKVRSVPAFTARPLYPQEQTSSGRPGRSVSCRTDAPQHLYLYSNSITWSARPSSAGGLKRMWSPTSIKHNLQQMAEEGLIERKRVWRGRTRLICISGCAIEKTPPLLSTSPS